MNRLRAILNSHLLPISLCLLLVSTTNAQEIVGQKFMPRAGAKFRKGEREIDPDTLSLPFSAVAVDGDWLDLGPARVQKSEVVPLEESAAYYTYYLIFHPATSWAYHHRGISWHASQQLDKAIKDYSEAIRLDPKGESSYNTRGVAFKEKGELDTALKDFDEAIRLNANSGLTFRNRGITRQTKGDLAGAMEDYTSAIRIDPTDHDSFNGRAWIKATAKHDRYLDPEKAVADATKACQLTKWENYGYLDTLAAAYAAAGDFQRAVEWQEKAISLAQLGDKADYESRLRLYRNSKPFRE